MAQEALGLIETVGLVPALAAADAAAKAAGVRVTRRINSRGRGMMTILVEGDVAAVQAAVEAAAAEARKVGTLVTAHVIPRPVEALGEMLGAAPPAVKAPAPRRRGSRNKADSESDNGG